MCGILGYVNKNFGENPGVNNIMESALISFSHRGPDSHGIWFSLDKDIGLGHNRLAIQDLSPSGEQPMISSDGNLVIIFNGELYNHLEIRQKLQTIRDIKWRGTSDTETLIESIAVFGIENTLKSIQGMFAFAVWDKKKCKLYLARDRSGEKPLCYSLENNGIIFGSQADTLVQFPWISNEISSIALREFLWFGFVPPNTSIFKSVKKLLPGSYLCFDQTSSSVSIQRYWDKISNINRNKNDFSDAKENLEKFDELLTEVVMSQCISDVPLGTFLSGGIDSSLITAIIQKNQTKRIDTFTIGFKEEKYNEAGHAKVISQYLGTKHHEKVVSQKDILESVFQLSNIFDEPFADTSVIPTLLLSKFAKESVVVALSGDGGDEVFYGYNRYLFAHKYYNNIQKFPKWSRSIGSKLSKNIFDYAAVKGLISSDKLLKAHKISQILNSSDNVGYYFELMKEDFPSELLISDQISMLNFLSEEDFQKLDSIDFNHVDIMAFLDKEFYLPGDILTKVDRSSMAYSLETRAPFLDVRVLEFANGLDYNEKIFNSQTKYILRKLLSKYLPLEMFERPKQGFGAPISVWMRNDLKNLIDQSFTKTSIVKQGIFDFTLINTMWQEFLNGNNLYTHLLWRVFVFQNWYHAKIKKEI